MSERLERIELANRHQLVVGSAMPSSSPSHVDTKVRRGYEIARRCVAVCPPATTLDIRDAVDLVIANALACPISRSRCLKLTRGIPVSARVHPRFPVVRIQAQAGAFLNGFNEQADHLVRTPAFRRPV